MPDNNVRVLIDKENDTWLIGTGYLNWHRYERVTDRYGSVGL